MAKKSLIQREKRRQKLEHKISFDSSILKNEISKVASLSDKLGNSWKVTISTTPRANFRDFGLSGHILREMVNTCLLPGATRSSW
ncbi:hypothetical protein RND81_O282700 [Saponaria officinalis]|uniref:Ribosomal protein S14 n=1 Tax=Saponaria officinalis TaxID=3572 RepID=A0AAW1GJ51_SAPOF